ncbi:cellulose biosynthesis cyclic di-GMP-binding regulatory protein BcsB, partial [Caballeronia sp. AAUFL_F1_KS45]|uniref:cellulose biosynthesis cyclic di-GMP-binding regulatory protein BcsB n=1 Tax=Caballeronia sp. AAUFL_F1_KS45 TaxID=2921770 RepID=UPI002028A4CB
GSVGEREPFQWSAWIRSDREVEVPVRLKKDGVAVSETVRRLKPGLNRVVFRDRIAEAGVRRYEVEVAGAKDRTPEND